MLADGNNHVDMILGSCQRVSLVYQSFVFLFFFFKSIFAFVVSSLSHYESWGQRGEKRNVMSEFNLLLRSEGRAGSKPN